MFIISTTMGNVISDSIPGLYSVNVSTARHNFLIIATTLIPFCWILSSFLHWYHNHKMDIGAATCGAKFVFGDSLDDMHLKEIEQKGEKSSSIEDLEVTIATVKEESENKTEDRLSETQ